MFGDEADYRRFFEGLEQTVGRFGWELLSFALKPNHVHLFLRTHQPNLSRSMQYLVSGYANWHAKRHRRPGHLTQGRFKAVLIEDESYFWTVSRYVHLNPVRGKRPLIAHPADWPWSSYPGYAHRGHRVDWVAYRSVLAAWQGEMGGTGPEAAYRRFVEAGLSRPPEDPFLQAVGGWLLGGPRFLERVRSRIKMPSHPDSVPAARRLWRCDYKAVLAAVAEHFDLEPQNFRRQRSGEVSRDLAAWLARELTPVTLRELSTAFGLTNPGSVENLIRRANRALLESASLRREVDAIRSSLAKINNQP
jgi:REP element-mobilizing transposase RayT